MKTPLFFVALAVIMPLHAATHAVLPGTSIQAKIDIAVAGDIVAIFGGTYNEDLTINKAIRLVEVSGQDVTITGSILFAGITDCPPFEGFRFGSAGRGISVDNTTGMVLRNLICTDGTGVAVSGNTPLKIVDCNLTDISMSGTSTLKLWNSQIRSLTASGSLAEIWDCSFSGAINQTTGNLFTTSVSVAGNFDTQTSALKTVAFRIIIAGDSSWRSKKAWFGYSKARSFTFSDANQAKVVVVGCEIDRQGGEANGIYCNVSNSSVLIANNSIIRVGYSYTGDAENGIDLRGGGNRAVVANNYCQLQYYANTDYGSRGDGIYVNPHFPALRSDPMALSGASRRKQIPCSHISWQPLPLQPPSESGVTSFQSLSCSHSTSLRTINDHKL